uniref:Uncharacterized protein n=1 Tax=Setaria italica TaxID=4555 RepID=K3YBK1_SETIT
MKKKHHESLVPFRFCQNPDSREMWSVGQDCIICTPKPGISQIKNQQLGWLQLYNEWI